MKPLNPDFFWLIIIILLLFFFFFFLVPLDVKKTEPADEKE